MKTLMTWLITLILSSLSTQVAAIQIERWTSGSGTPVIFYQTTTPAMLDIMIAFHAGSAYDGQRFGLSSLTTHLLNQGNATLDADTIALQFADVGAQYSSDVSRDSAIISLRTLSEPLACKQALQTLTQVIGQPNFPEASFLREKNQHLMNRKQVEDSPEDLADETFYRALYQNHPYAHPITGTEATLKAIARDDVRQFYKRFFVKQNAVIILVGAVDKTTAIAIANTITKALPEGSRAQYIKSAEALKEELNIEVPFKAPQTSLRLGSLGISHQDPDYFPLLVGNYILGGGKLSSRLNHELREKSGLTYGVYSQFISMPAKGPFVIGFSTKPSTAKIAQTSARKLLSQFIQTGPSQSELREAQQYLVGSFPLSLAGNGAMAHVLLHLALFELPNEYLDTYTSRIKAVSIEDIQHALKRHINADHLLDVQVGSQ